MSVTEAWIANDLFLHRATLAMLAAGVGMACWIALHLPWSRDRMHGPASSADERQGICSTCTSCPRCPQAERGVSDEKLAAEIDLACQAIAASYGLSAREREILPYLLRGHKALSIAHALDVSESTVRMHVRRMHSKLGVGPGDGLFGLLEGHGLADGQTPPAAAPVRKQRR